MKKILLLAVAGLFLGSQAFAQYALPALNYGYSDLEPYLDSATVYIHYNKHHQGYANKLNDVLEKYPDYKSFPIEDLLDKVNQMPAAIRTKVRNFGGGYYNHNLYWSLLTTKEKSVMSPALVDSINANFGSVERMKEYLLKASSTVFGSGWVWLVRADDGKIKLLYTANQDNPLMSKNKAQPILAIDLWEHAYYLKFQNNREAYINSIWEIINWAKVEELMK